MHRTRPSIPRSYDQPVESDVAEPPDFNEMRLKPFTGAICRPRVKFAWTAVIAIAGRDFWTSDLPIDIGHDCLSFAALVDRASIAGPRTRARLPSEIPI